MVLGTTLPDYSLDNVLVKFLINLYSAKKLGKKKHGFFRLVIFEQLLDDPYGFIDESFNKFRLL